MPCAPSQGARIYYEETGKLVEDLFDVVLQLIAPPASGPPGAT
jgi:hypothetical protein